jgi:putative redox protein
MTVRTKIRYEGDLHCVAVHGPSGDTLTTDAPVDNRGRGEHFSPTDLVGAAMGTCMLTIMGIAARDRGIDMVGAHAEVLKDMGATPRRHIANLTVRIHLPARLGDRERAVLEAAARGCPVHASLGALTHVDLGFVYE